MRRTPAGLSINEPYYLYLPLLPLYSSFLVPLSLFSIGFASFTLMLLPLKSVLFICSIAFFASSSFVISTNPKPFERSDNLSMIMTALWTVPIFLNNSFQSSSVVSNTKLPTYSFNILFSFV